jgi:DNA-binding NarL/FixJ family response regulator
LRRAVRVVAAGDALLAPEVTRRLIAAFSSGPAVPGLHALTAREREVVTLVADGLSNAEVGARLGMSPATAKTHTNRAMTKLGARDRAQLVVFAYRGGLAGVRRPR